MILTDTSSEEPFAAIAARSPVMLPGGSVPTDRAQWVNPIPEQASIRGLRYYGFCKEKEVAVKSENGKAHVGAERNKASQHND